MNTHQLLNTLDSFFQNQTALKELKHTQLSKIQKIEQDTRRTAEQKQLAIQRLKDQEKKLASSIQPIKDAQLKTILTSSGEKKSSAYEDILPLIQLICKIENDTNAEKYAIKLAAIFANKEDVVHYLHLFAMRDKENLRIAEDACSFTPPSPSAYQQHWLQLARAKHGENLLNPRFLKLLQASTDIEKQLDEDKKNLKELLLNVKESEKSINEQIKPLKKFCDAFMSGHLRDGRNTLTTLTHRENLKMLQELYSKRAILHLTKTFDHYSVQDIEDVYKRLLLKDDSREYFNKLGIDDAGYQRFSALDRSKAGKNIPDILIDCGNGFYIKKLNVQNTREAAIAACLGKLSDCCQSISAAGERYTLHGLTSKDSGFYVLFKGDYRHPDMENDVVYGQTWVNRTLSGMLLFDSIESAQALKNDKIKSIVIAAYRQLANTLIKKQCAPKVQCGIQSGISIDVGAADINTKSDMLRGYKQTTDADKQLFLSDAKLFVKFTEHGWLLDEKRWQRNLVECEKHNTLTKVMRFNLDFALRHKISVILSQCNNHPLLKHYLKQQMLYSYALKVYDDGELTEKEYLNYLRLDYHKDTIVGDDNNALHIAVRRGDLKIVSKLIASKMDLETRNFEGLSPLAIAALAGNKTIFAKLIEAKASVNGSNTRHCNPLMQAIISGNDNVDAIHMLIASKAAIDQQTQRGYTALMFASEFNSVKVAKALINAKANVNLQSSHPYFVNALIEAVARNHKEIVALLTEHKCNVNARTNDSEKQTPLMIAAFNQEIQPAITEILLTAKADPFMRNSSGQTALMVVFKQLGNRETIKMLKIAMGRRNETYTLPLNLCHRITSYFFPKEKSTSVFINIAISKQKNVLNYALSIHKPTGFKAYTGDFTISTPELLSKALTSIKFKLQERVRSLNCGIDHFKLRVTSDKETGIDYTKGNSFITYDELEAHFIEYKKDLLWRMEMVDSRMSAVHPAARL